MVVPSVAWVSSSTMPSRWTGRGLGYGRAVARSAARGTSARVEAEAAQVGGAAEPGDQGLQPGGCVVDTERGGRGGHGGGRRRGVVGHRVGKHHGVGGGVREAEAAAERVAELVVQPHGHGLEAPAGEPRAVEQVGARVEVVGVAVQRPQPAGEGAEPGSASASVSAVRSAA